MSTIQSNKNVWSSTNEKPDSKYEKCRNITEEIYKRINITFQIKKMEGTQSEVSEQSDQIDSNELSNETDLFACDKSDCISSSTEADKPAGTCEKYININNNEETKKKASVISSVKRPKKRFRKRVKKRQSKTAESDGSSDEAPLSRMTDGPKVKGCGTQTPDNVMGVPKIVLVTKDLKTPNQASPRQAEAQTKNESLSQREEEGEKKGDCSTNQLPFV